MFLHFLFVLCNSDSTGLHNVVHLAPKSHAYDLLSRMLEYDPRKRITAAQALEHEYFKMEPLPGRNAFVPIQSGEEGAVAVHQGEMKDGPVGS